jgi:peptide/nickel transport system ATP-binding protein
MEESILLDVKGLKTHFFLDEGTVKAVEDVSFCVKHGTVLGIVGESGCGKSVTALSILKLVEKPGRIIDGQMLLCAPGETPVDIAALNEHSRSIRRIRGNRIAMIFQEPMNSLSPVHAIGSQIIEAIRQHQAVSKREARAQAIDRLRTVGIPRSEELIDAYTFQLSGGMRQRAMIAMALACNPNLLIADEPTTALDVTTQAQILELMKDLQQQFGSSVMLITHDLGVVAEMCDEVVVMYLGEVVEEADVVSLFHNPLHPYTRALIRSIPRLGYGRRQELHLIEGSVPNPFQRPMGCPFHPRCNEAIPGYCDIVHPQTTTLPDGRKVRCLLYENGGPRPENMEA